jgi:hypothetical protein
MSPARFRCAMLLGDDCFDGNGIGELGIPLAGNGPGVGGVVASEKKKMEVDGR